jgi:hypothetical protein
LGLWKLDDMKCVVKRYREGRYKEVERGIVIGGVPRGLYVFVVEILYCRNHFGKVWGS